VLAKKVEQKEMQSIDSALRHRKVVAGKSSHRDTLWRLAGLGMTVVDADDVEGGGEGRGRVNEKVRLQNVKGGMKESGWWNGRMIAPCETAVWTDRHVRVKGGWLA
jgi:hypothetical protein